MGVVLQGKLPLANIAATEEAMYNAMSKIGELGVEYAVEMHEFKNQTFNLQDSYGYAVYFNGQIVGNPMMAQKRATKPNEVGGIEYSGREEGFNLLDDFNAPSQGWSVVVVAGMVYASFVEEYYGLDVLQGSEQEAKVASENIFNQIQWDSILRS